MRFYTRQHKHYCGIDLHARTMYLCIMNQAGDVLLHQNTHHQYNLPEPTRKIIHKSNRVGLAEHFDDPAARRSIAIDLELVAHYDKIINDLELYLVRTAKQHDANRFHLLRSVPGIGKILALTILYEIHDIGRFPTVQDFASYARLIKCAKESSGKRLGTSGGKIGNVHLKWAFSEAAVLFLARNERGKQLLARLTRKHGKGKALSILAHKLGRDAYHMLQREPAFDMEKFLAA